MKRTAEIVAARHPLLFSRPFHGLPFYSCHPSSELLGYFQSSAKRGLRRATSCAKVARRYDLALEQARSTYELDPNLVAGIYFLVQAYNSNGMHGESIDLCEKWLCLKSHGSSRGRTNGGLLGQSCEKWLKADPANQLLQFLKFAIRNYGPLFFKSEIRNPNSEIQISIPRLGNKGDNKAFVVELNPGLKVPNDICNSEGVATGSRHRNNSLTGIRNSFRVAYSGN